MKCDTVEIRDDLVDGYWRDAEVLRSQLVWVFCEERVAASLPGETFCEEGLD